MMRNEFITGTIDCERADMICKGTNKIQKMKLSLKNQSTWSTMCDTRYLAIRIGKDCLGNVKRDTQRGSEGNRAKKNCAWLWGGKQIDSIT